MIAPIMIAIITNVIFRESNLEILELLSPSERHPTNIRCKIAIKRYRLEELNIVCKDCVSTKDRSRNRQ